MKVMREYKVKRGESEPLTDEEIFKYKDFGKLTTNYEQALTRLHKKPLYKDPKALIALILIILVFYLVMMAVEEENSQETNPPAETEQVQP